MVDTDTLPRAARGARESEAASPAGPDAPARRTLSYEALRFPGSRPIPMLRDGFEAYDGRLEYWDVRNGTAWVVAESSGIHEGSSRRLPHLVERIASVRGAPIVSFGSVSLVMRDAEGRAERALEADETLYLHPDRAATPERSLTVGEHDFPDVVLEVDHTTDVRPGKLLLYEAWGFPELWVVVPPAGATRRRPAGVTIHRLEGGRYRSAAESTAFPGWTAAEIHAGLTEPVPTPATSRVLERVGRALGVREERGPEDDPLSRVLIAEGRTRELAAAVQSVLRLRGLSFSPAFAEHAAAFSGIARDTVMGPRSDVPTRPTSGADSMSKRRPVERRPRPHDRPRPVTRGCGLSANRPHVRAPGLEGGEHALDPIRMGRRQIRPLSHVVVEG